MLNFQQALILYQQVRAVATVAPCIGAESISCTGLQLCKRIVSCINRTLMTRTVINFKRHHTRQLSETGRPPAARLTSPHMLCLLALPFAPFRPGYHYPL